MGRTHSVHAEPTTLGLKLAGWAFELDRGRRRLAAAVDEIGTGKISGPVGTYSHLGPDIEAEVLGALGPARRSGQHADRPARPARGVARPRSPSSAARSSASRPRSATSSTPRSASSRSPSSTGQKGARAMPHKRNPILSERIAGLARLLRGYAHDGARGPAAVARAGHQPLVGRAGDPAGRDDPARLHAGADDRAWSTGCVVRGERMRENIERGLGLHASSRVLVALVEQGGLSREEAYAIVQRAALRAADERRPLRELPRRRPGRRRARSASPQLDACFDDAAFLRHVPTSSPDSTAWTPPRALGTPRRRGRMPLADTLRPLRQGARPVRAGRRSAAARRVATASARSTWSCRPPIPDKGRVLTGLSRYWFARDRRGIVAEPPARRPTRRVDRDRPGSGADGRPAGRAARPDDALPPRDALPVEIIVRGYLAGSGWKDYQRRAPCAASPLPAGLRESDRLPEPIFTPSTKAEAGRTTRTSTSTRWSSWSGADRRRARRARSRLGRCMARAGGRRAGRDHPGRHQVRVRAAGGRRPGRAARPRSTRS